MKILKCLTCGAPLDPMADGVHYKCNCCGNIHIEDKPVSDYWVEQMNEANDLRNHFQFDLAINKYRTILAQDPTDATAYWGMLLSTYGIGYEKDYNEMYVPNFHRYYSENILENENYINALKYASEEKRQYYINQGNEISNIQQGIKDIVNTLGKNTYDVFISYKDSDILPDGRRVKTRARDVAFNIYNALTEKGIKTFFSEVSLRGNVASNYEPVIFNALDTSKVFILVADTAEHIYSTWVRNEWSRMLEMVRQKTIQGLKPTSYFAVIGQDFDLSLLPQGTFSKTQNVMLQNYAGDSYKNDIALSVCNLLGINKTTNANNIDSLKEEMLKAFNEQYLKNNPNADKIRLLNTKAEVALELSKYNDLVNCANKILELEPLSSTAYLYKLFAETEVNSLEELANTTFDYYNNENFKLALKFADNNLKESMQNCINSIDKNIIVAKQKEEERKQKEEERIKIAKQKEKEDKENKFFEDNFSYNYNKDGSVAITKFIGKDKDVVIPNKYKGLPVTKIGENAFKSSDITSVTIPNSITSIGNFAFEGCYSLNGVKITDITAWLNIDFEKFSVNPLFYAHKLYLNGKLLTDLVIPEGVTQIKEHAFSRCSSLTSITIPSSVTSIESYAFEGCRSLKNINIPNNITSIGEFAFTKCDSLTSITIPNTVDIIGMNAFALCKNLKVIYCEAPKKPKEWDNDWNKKDSDGVKSLLRYKVVWGSKGPNE